MKIEELIIKKSKDFASLIKHEKIYYLQGLGIIEIDEKEDNRPIKFLAGDIHHVELQLAYPPQASIKESPGFNIIFLQTLTYFPSTNETSLDRGGTRPYYSFHDGESTAYTCRKQFVKRMEELMLPIKTKDNFPKFVTDLSHFNFPECDCEVRK